MKFNTKIIKVANHESFWFNTVWEITAMKDGAIFKTKNTGLFIHRDKASLLPKDKYTLSSLSTKLTRQRSFNLEVITSIKQEKV